ncbi:Sideroflexin-2 [Toxocara canis]|uniref:Sidoreflexin n=1 Tax=Toxocara canis TaxID=6265 RepID=A0A0B2VMB1_TOXCA|nr:Sideroflexin-2 [Toxocara canis]
MNTRYDVDEPRWNQSTFYGRLCHFASITDPRKIFASPETLRKSKLLLEQYKKGQVPNGTRLEDIYRAQAYYGSAFHPDTGELQNLAGRMCANVYGGTILCGAMMIWYKSTPAVVFWQWSNQSFNALVNYTNRNAKSPLSTQDLLVAYSSAVTGALGVALGLKYYFAKRAYSITAQRLVPYIAVAVANAINIPLVRQNELINGLLVTDENNNEVGRSKLAACKAISLVVISRNVIAAPSMMLTPSIVDLLCKLKWFARNLKVLNIPTQLTLTFLLYGAMVPVGCALYPQKNSLNVEALRRCEPDAYETIRKSGVQRIYFNKGL